MGNQTSSEDNITDKVVIITGANTGIGFETAIELVKRGAHVVMACRNEARGQEAFTKVKNETKSEKVYLDVLDLGDLQSVRDFAKRFRDKWDRLDILINNAGAGNENREVTKDGFEMCFGVNHLGHFLLTNLLLDLLKKSAPSRIINLASMAYLTSKMKWEDLQWEKHYTFMSAYGQSKLANMLFTVELAKRLQATNVTAVSVHPGVVQTELFRNINGCSGSVVSCFLKLFAKTPQDGAKTTIHCATNPDVPNQAGSFFANSKVKSVLNKAKNPQDALKLWETSEELLGLKT